jgi:hypothetical protein
MNCLPLQMSTPMSKKNALSSAVLVKSSFKYTGIKMPLTEQALLRLVKTNLQPG